MDPTATSAKCNQVLHRPGFPAFGPNLRDTDNLSPPTPKESYRTRQSKNNSSRCSIFGNKGKIDSPSDSDEFGEEVIYSQEFHRWINLLGTSTGGWIGLLRSDRLLQEKKYYHLVVILLIGIKIIPQYSD